MERQKGSERHISAGREEALFEQMPRSRGEHDVYQIRWMLSQSARARMSTWIYAPWWESWKEV